MRHARGMMEARALRRRVVISTSRWPARVIAAVVVIPLLLSGMGGCASHPVVGNAMAREALRDEAVRVLIAAVAYRPNPAVRAQAVEAFESSGVEERKPWIRTAIQDDHPAVRFAACVAVGTMRDALATSALLPCVDDDDPSVRVGALFALHRLGDTTRSGGIPTVLLHGETPAARRNAALVLGRLEEPGVIKMLARAMRDEEIGVRHHALEAMARLGNEEAAQELAFMANSGVGPEEVFALGALSQTGNPKYVDAYRHKLSSATHVETKLAAARALGTLGLDDGLPLALRELQHDKARYKDPDDPPEGQVLRSRQMAAVALGSIGRTDALPALTAVMRDGRDPRLQVAAAKAILEILRANPPPPQDVGFGSRVGMRNGWPIALAVGNTNRASPAREP